MEKAAHTKSISNRITRTFPTSALPMLMIFILSGFFDFLSIPVIFLKSISDQYDLSEIYGTNK